MWNGNTLEWGMIVAEIPQDLHKQIRGIEAKSPLFGALRPRNCLWQFRGCMLSCRSRKGLQRKAHRICMGKSEDLERKARFLALCAKNVPKF
jgi:hypothetical protein